MSRPKHTLVRICGFLALLLAAGCSSFAVSTPSEPPAAGEGVDITVQIAPFDKPVEITSLQKRITRFREKYPGINVHTDNWRMPLTRSASGLPPIRLPRSTTPTPPKEESCCSASG